MELSWRWAEVAVRWEREAVRLEPELGDDLLDPEKNVQVLWAWKQPCND
jgi:hypothetical protein